MLICGICDDEPLALQHLTSLVRAWADNRGLDVQVRAFPSAEAFLFSYGEDRRWDLLLLDIQMEKMDGVMLAKKLRADNERTQIVFVTGYPDFMAAGYDVSALHYLMKPVQPEKLRAVLDKAAARLLREEPAVLVTGDGITEKIPEKDILYARIDGSRMQLVCKARTLDLKLRLKELEALLQGGGFTRCHRSYIVGLGHIRQITKKELILDNGAALPLARRAYHEVNQAFIRYFKGARQ